MQWITHFVHSIIEHDKAAFDRLLRHIENNSHKRRMINDGINNEGITPLMIAVKYISNKHHGLYFISRLLEEGADPNAKDGNDVTVYGHAVNRTSKNIVYNIIRLLLRHGLKFFPMDKFFKVYGYYYKDEYTNYVNRYHRIRPFLTDRNIRTGLCVSVHRFL